MKKVLALIFSSILLVGAVEDHQTIFEHVIYENLH
jgi:hypothetical protein